MSKLLLWFVKVTGYIPHLFYFKKKVYYVDKQKSSRKIKGKAIIISNHKSVFDVALYMFVFPFRDLYMLVGEVMYKKGKLFGWFLNKIGGIKVERESYDFDFINKALVKLEKGKVVEIYPESRLPLEHEKKILPFKPSFVYLALESGAPIIPVYTNGEYGTKKRTKVLIGEKIYLSELYNDSKTEKENIDYLCNYVRNYLERMEETINNEEKSFQK